MNDKPRTILEGGHASGRIRDKTTLKQVQVYTRKDSERSREIGKSRVTLLDLEALLCPHGLHNKQSARGGSHFLTPFMPVSEFSADPE
jgi:hypothetical protein